MNKMRCFFCIFAVFVPLICPLAEEPDDLFRDILKPDADAEELKELLADKKPANIKFSTTKDKNSIRIAFRLMNPEPLKMEIDYGTKKILKVTIYPGEQVIRKYISYQDMAQIKTRNPNYQRDPGTSYPNSKITFDGLGITCYVLPNFDRYNDNILKKEVNDWVKILPSCETKTFTLEIRSVPEEKEIHFYLNGNYAYRLTRTEGLKEVRIIGGKGPEIKATLFQGGEPPHRQLDFSFMNHTSELLIKKAELSFAPGVREFDGIPLRVFAPEKSLDIGRYRMMCWSRSLFDNPYWERTPFDNMPESLHFTVPNKFYSHALILCAVLPGNGRIPVLGTRLTRMGGIGGNSRAHHFTDLSEKDNPNVKQVGTLNYQDENGVRKDVPLYLVKHFLNSGEILDIINDPPRYQGGYLTRTLPKLHDYLDFEFLGDRNYFSSLKSSVQVFACTLLESPFTMEMRQSEQGNIFADDEKPETVVELSGEKGKKGFLQYEIYDSAFKPVQKKEIEFEIVETGKPQNIIVDLAMEKLGWYGIRFVLLDSKKEMLFRHEGAFALLGKDTREAGFESPYAAWPQLGNYSSEKDCWPDAGRHNCNPDRLQVAKIMHKAGYHQSWHCPVKSDDEIPEYQMTFSMFGIGGKPYADDDTLEERLEKSVAEVKELRKRFPNCRQIMVLHEAGGRDLAPEMRNRKAEVKPYDPVNGDSLTRFAMKCAQRIRKEFPELKIILGNGSSSSEIVAHLFRNGFDPKMVDYLGIESKGFQTMPEINDNREAPGMAWALRETGRRFGYDIPVSACNEFVFRPERIVTPENDTMSVTKYSLRDYLICLGFNFLTISTGHIEDCKTSYYDTNWGAGGQLKCFPYSYPKRLYVALATLTKVMDKTVFSRRLPTGELSTYALEFKRNRKMPDYAYAFWTPEFETELSVTFPPQTTVTQVEVFGNSNVLKPDETGAVAIRFSGVPTYLIADKPAVSSKILRHFPVPLPEGKKEEFPISTVDVEPRKNYILGNLDPIPGEFLLTDAEDPEKGKVLQADLIPGEIRVPEVVTEYQLLKLKKPLRFETGNTDFVGIWVKGNSSWGNIRFEWMNAEGRYRVQNVSMIHFEGWQMRSVKPPFENGRKGVSVPYFLTGIYVESARLALDPLEMRPVERGLRLGTIVRFGR